MEFMKESIADTNQLAILRMLKKAKGRYISGELVSRKADVSRAAIWKHVSALKKYGYRIASRQGQGYRLVETSSRLLPWEITENLRTKYIGKEIHHFDTIDSTQDLAVRLAERNAHEGTIIIAEKQKKGRGRIGRQWSAPEGGIWLSLILRPKMPTAESTILPLAAALAVCDAIRYECDVDAKVKWPNDILIRGKKVAGILVEMSCEADRINYVVIGIGINANVNIRKIIGIAKRTPGYYGATSLMKETGDRIDRISLVRSLLTKLEEIHLTLEARRTEPVIQAWKERSDMMGSNVTVFQDEVCFKGQAVDIDYDGALLVKLPDGNVKRVVAGDVHVRFRKQEKC
jgi:BirA family biotin operon repressor/biotin-[acetyl-CoA-carboxylase] ligase